MRIRLSNLNKVSDTFPPSFYYLSKQDNLLVFLCSETSVTAFPRLSSDCQRPVDHGTCSSPIQMWAFDGIRCVPFTYGGCGGNLNRFFTRTHCEATCGMTTTTMPSTIKDLRKATTTRRYVIKTKSSCRKPRVITLG